MNRDFVELHNDATKKIQESRGAKKRPSREIQEARSKRGKEKSYYGHLQHPLFIYSVITSVKDPLISSTTNSKFKLLKLHYFL